MVTILLHGAWVTCGAKTPPIPVLRGTGFIIGVGAATGDIAVGPRRSNKSFAALVVLTAGVGEGDPNSSAIRSKPPDGAAGAAGAVLVTGVGATAPPGVSSHISIRDS